MRCRTRKPSVTERNHLEQAHYTCTCISPYMIICCNHEQGHAPQKKHMIRISFTLAMDHPANRSVPDVYPVALQAPCATGCASPFQPSHMLGLKGQSLEASSNMPMPQVASCPLQPSLAPVFSNDMAGGFGVPTFGAPLAEPCNTAIELGPATTEMHSLGQANPDAQPYQAQAVSGPHGVPNMPCDMSGAVAAPPSQPCDMPQPSLMLGPLSQPGLIGQTLGPSSNMPMPQVEPSPMQPSVVPLFSNDMGVGFGVPTFGAPHADPCKCIALAKPVQMYSKVLSICPQPFQAPTKVM